jgi:hypothetical protein
MTAISPAVAVGGSLVEKVVIALLPVTVVPAVVVTVVRLTSLAEKLEWLAPAVVAVVVVTLIRVRPVLLVDPAS